ncbi:glycoside hydrolase family 2 protein [Halomicrobium urmianum]|uniref:glycoside hydrolase family 2 protein n=1 Tax=Halomicrobium urmianum TaxID=1586233 RepID=UPI001CDA1422|nr:sugar-binding domain-containing protein [Halomicrobium urmianum]
MNRDDSEQKERRRTASVNGTSTQDGGLSRRRLLRTSAAVSMAGLAGCSALEAGRDPWPGPGDHDWTPAEPPLATPWFEAVDPEDPHAEYPRPQLVRDRWRHLNGVWGFEAVDELGDPPTERGLEVGILVPFPVESALSGIAREEDQMWYRRTFEVPEDWDVGDDEHLLLHFEAVDYEATVYVNGEEVGSHVGGYDHFAVDITDAVSDVRRQELIVGVADETEEGQTLGKQHPNDGPIWYTPTSGIWQSVWMEPVPSPHVTGLDTTPDLENERLALTVDATDAAADLTVEATARADGETAATATGAPGEELSLSIPDPQTWSPEDPFLYDVTVRLLRDGEAVDAVESYFGMRSIGYEEIDGHQRMTLNGEVSFALAALDQGFWPDGIYTPPTDEAQIFDLEKHRELGFNTVRKHVKIEPRRWYYHADRLGLVVHQDMPSTADFTGTPEGERRDQFETELRAMIDQLGNHPSITAWVPFNEGWGIYDAERITEAVRERDPERLVNPNSGANVDGGDCECGAILDFHNYPGPGPAPPTDDRLSVIGEFGGLGLALDGHEWGSESYSYDAYSSPAELTEAYVGKLELTRLFAGQSGLSSAVYTQLTDVETENNGLLTYDRKAVKPDADRVREANEALIDAATTLDDGDGP